MANSNTRIELASHPSGEPTEADFRIETVPVPDPDDGQVLIRTIHLSLDPYMRGRMQAGPSYAPALEIGEVMTGGIVGEVVASRTSEFSAGTIVNTHLGWQAFGVADPGDLRRVDPKLAPISTALGVLGMPGTTAYFGLLEIGQPRPGETVVVSAASGAVGALVGQIAKIKGCRVVGIAGSEAKCAYIMDELGLDAAINYKIQNVEDALAETCPDGIDVYFDNVGGGTGDAVLKQINTGARISVCGAISEYNNIEPELGPRAGRILLTKQARMEGFLMFQFADRHEEGRRQMAEWIGQGRIKYREDFVDGLENAPRVFIGLFRGENFGKLIVRVGNDPTA
jgi:hypothetical protein